MLDENNFKSGFLMDGPFMAGISKSADSKGFSVYLLNTETAETLEFVDFRSQNDAIHYVNRGRENWIFQSMASGCEGCDDENGCNPVECGREDCFAKR